MPFSAVPAQMAFVPLWFLIYIWCHQEGSQKESEWELSKKDHKDKKKKDEKVGDSFDPDSSC